MLGAGLAVLAISNLTNASAVACKEKSRREPSTVLTPFARPVVMQSPVICPSALETPALHRSASCRQEDVEIEAQSVFAPARDAGGPSAHPSMQPRTSSRSASPSIASNSRAFTGRASSGGPWPSGVALLGRAHQRIWRVPARTCTLHRLSPRDGVPGRPVLTGGISRSRFPCFVEPLGLRLPHTVNVEKRGMKSDQRDPGSCPWARDRNSCPSGALPHDSIARVASSSLSVRRRSTPDPGRRSDHRLTVQL